jgi:hypothetical protein
MARFCILELHCRYHQDQAIKELLDPEEDGVIIIRNVGNYKLNLAALHPRINESSATPSTEI